MAEKKTYEIVRISDTTYLDDANQVVQGVQVDVRLLEYNERRLINLPTDDPKQIETEIKSLLDRRKILADLG